MFRSGELDSQGIVHPLCHQVLVVCPTIRKHNVPLPPLHFPILSWNDMVDVIIRDEKVSALFSSLCVKLLHHFAPYPLM